MSEAKKLKPGPKRKLSDSARKRNKKAANAKLNKNRIYIGDEYDRWMEIKLSVAYARWVYSCRDPTMGQLLLNIHDIMFRNGVSSNLPLHDTSVKSGK
jgi:hypothetical protein